MPAQRRLSAIMFTDVVGFSRSAHTDEARTLERLAEHERTVRPILRRHAGREVKTIGDSFLVEFESALDACRCAVEIQQRADPSFILRIGIHLGDVVHRAGDVFGDAVNIASRVERTADGGGICVSQQVADQVANKLGLPLVRRSGATLRGIDTPIAVYAIELPGTGPRPSSSVGRVQVGAAATPARRRLAVLPMANLTADPGLAYLADGFTEELILRLSKVPDFHVLARSTVMRFKGATKSPAEIARELDVEAILEGSVRSHGHRLRITTTLVDPGREEPLWSEAYDRRLTDLFAVQGEIADRTALALRVHLSPDARRELARPTTRSEAALGAYLRGRFEWNQRTDASLRRAISEYDAALAADPGMALAHAGLADAYAAQALLEFERPDDSFPKAREAIARALALDANCCEALTALGVVRCQYERDWSGSEAAFRRAIAVNPNYAPAHHQFADLLKALGRWEEAMAEIRAALSLDPLSLAINTGVGHVLYLSRRYDEAIAQYRRTLELDPSFVQAHLWFGRPYLEKGMFREALAELEQAAAISGGSTIALAVLAHAYAAAGRSDRARELLQQLKRRARARYVPSYWIGLVYVGLGDAGHAFAWLLRAQKEHSSWLTWAMVEPRFDPIRNDPRFRRLLADMNLPPGGTDATGVPLTRAPVPRRAPVGRRPVPSEGRRTPRPKARRAPSRHRLRRPPGRSRNGRAARRHPVSRPRA